MPGEGDIEQVYFFQTEEGMRANAEVFWPLDEEERLLPGVSIEAH
jgi:hypothetical protein